MFVTPSVKPQNKTCVLMINIFNVKANTLSVLTVAHLSQKVSRFFLFFFLLFPDCVSILVIFCPAIFSATHKTSQQPVKEQ